MAWPCQCRLNAYRKLFRRIGGMAGCPLKSGGNGWLAQRSLWRLAAM